MQSVFRPKLWHWLQRNVAVPAFGVLVIILLVIDRFSIPALILSAIVCLIALLGIGRVLSNFIAIDNRQISGKFQQQTFRVMWWDVRAAWVDVHGDTNPVLMLATDQTLYAIPLRYMDAQAIWELARARVNPAALAEEARQALPYWQPVGVKHIPELEQPFVLRGRALEKIAGWCGLISSCGILSAGFSQFTTGLALILAGFGLFSAGFLLSTYYSLKISGNGITHQTLLGRFFISWDELKSVHIAQDGSTVLFQSGRKRILVYGPRTWSKTSREDVMQYIGLQLEVRQIHVRVDPWLGLRMAFSNRAARIKDSTEM